MWLIDSLMHIANPCSFCGHYRWLQMVPCTSVVSDKDGYVTFDPPINNL